MDFRTLLIGTLGLLLLCGFGFSTVVMLNSLDYEDIISADVYAKANGHNYVFALTPNQSVFMVRYYTAYSQEKIIYIEGSKPVLPNMEALLRDSGASGMQVVRPPSVPVWVAEQFPKTQAIIVGAQYGQDALAVAPYAALTKSPLLFIGGATPYPEVFDYVKAQGYGGVIVYGPVAQQVPASQLDSLPNKKVIDTGSRYDNNLQIVSEFLKLSPTQQAIFVSGRTFEKSMVDTSYPIILMGRSDVSSETTSFLAANKIVSGIVFAGDADIVDSVTKMKNTYSGISIFAKFGEGYLGSSQPLPLTIIPLPAPTISLEILNLSYNVPSKLFELRIRNKGDFTALSSGISIPALGSADSPLVYLDPGSITTIAIPMDASSAISNNRIPQATLTVRYGEDTRLLDNIDTVNYLDIGISEYSDSSSIRVISFTYNSDTKAFELALDGSGYVEGVVRFSINQVPYLIRISNTLVDGQTTVQVKYLLSQDEERFINGLPSEYSLRFGGKSDILLKEAKGTISTGVKTSKPIFDFGQQPGSSTSGEDGGIPWLLIVGVLAVLGVVAFVAMRARGPGGDFE